MDENDAEHLKLIREHEQWRKDNGFNDKKHNNTGVIYVSFFRPVVNTETDKFKEYKPIVMYGAPIRTKGSLL